MDDNLLIQLQLSDRSTEILENGGFEDFTGSDPDGWTVVKTGASTITQELTDLRPGTSGSSAVRFTYDATPGVARISQTKTFIPEAWCYLKFWYKCNSFSSSKNWSMRIRDSAANVYLQDDLKTWDSTINDIEIPCSDNWTYFEIKGLLTHPDYSSYFIGLGNGNTITSDYIIIDDLEFKLDTTFCAFEQVSWNGAQWLKNMTSASIRLQDNSAYRGDREQSGLSVSLNDWPAKYFRGILQNFDTNVIIGNGAIVRKADGTKISDYVITDISKPEEIITFKLGDGYAELENNTAPPQITEEEFPFAPESTLNNFINHFSGQFQVSGASFKGVKDYLVAWRVQDRTISTTDGRYLIGKSIQDIISWGGGQDFQYCVDSNDTDRTATCTLITPTASDPYHYVDLASSIADVEYIKVHFKYPAISVETMIEEIGELLFTSFEFDISDIDLLLGWGGRHYNKFTPGAQDNTDPHFVLDKNTKYIDILNQLCKAFNMSYYVDAERKIVFKIFDYNALYDSGETTALQPNVSGAFISTNDKEEYSELTNYVNISWGYFDGSTSKQMPFQNYESQKRWNNVKDEPIEAPFFPANYSISKRFAFQTAKLLMIDKFNTQKEVTFEITPRSVVEDLKPLHILKFKHDNFNDDEFHYMQIRRMNFQYPGDSVTVDFIDISHIAEIDTNGTFLLQSNDENGSFIYLDRSANGYHWVDNNSNSTKHDNTYPLFGKSSITNNGSTPDMRFGLFFYLSTLHIFAAMAANDFNSSQLSMWVRFNNSGNQEMIASQYVDPNNYWWLYKNTGDNIRMFVYNGGVTRLNLLATGTNFGDGKWHHILFYRTDARAALYVDGLQRDNSTATLNYTYGSEWHLMNDGNSGNYMDGNIQDVYVALNYGAFLEDRDTGWFNCSPDAGDTDAYIKPYGLMSNSWQKYWVDLQ